MSDKIVSAQQILSKETLKLLKDAGFVVVHDNLEFSDRVTNAIVKGRWPEERSLKEDYNSAISISISIQNEKFKETK